jgi:hypothetical protein
MFTAFLYALHSLYAVSRNCWRLSWEGTLRGWHCYCVSEKYFSIFQRLHHQSPKHLCKHLYPWLLLRYANGGSERILGDIAVCRNPEKVSIATKANPWGGNSMYIILHLKSFHKWGVLECMVMVKWNGTANSCYACHCSTPHSQRQHWWEIMHVTCW